jgi:hypothetical protein
MRSSRLFILTLALGLAACSKSDNSSNAAPAAAPAAAATPATPAAAPSAPATPATSTPSTESVLNFPNYGFQISGFDAPTSGSVVQAAIMFLPPNAEMTPSINVLLQPAPNGFATYVSDSKKVLDQNGYKIVQQTDPSSGNWTVEYIGLLQGRPVHWYARALFSNGMIYLATGTLLDDEWNQYGSVMKQCVDSFQTGSGASGSALNFPNYGFHINALDAPMPDAPVQALMLSLPVDGKFAPSVNVQIQPYAKGFADYITESKAQMQKYGLQITTDNSSATDWRVEYIGLVQSQAMHWYAHAIWANNRVYLATGGSLDEQWTKYSDKIKGCIDSLQTTGTATFTPVSPAPATGSATSGAIVPSSTPAAGTPMPTGN